MQSFILGVMALAVHLLGMVVMALLFGYGSSDMSPFPPIVCNEDIFCGTRPPCAEKFSDQYKWIITVTIALSATRWNFHMGVVGKQVDFVNEQKQCAAHRRGAENFRTNQESHQDKHYGFDGPRYN